MAHSELWTLPRILSASKNFRWKYQPCPTFYPHPNIPDTFPGDEMNSYRSQLKQERGRVELFKSFWYLTLDLLRIYLDTNICYFESLISPWRGPQLGSLFWTVLLDKTHHAKFHLLLRPPSSFLWVFWNYWQILSSKKILIFFMCKILVIAAPNKHFLGVWD